MTAETEDVEAATDAAAVVITGVDAIEEEAAEIADNRIGAALPSMTGLPKIHKGRMSRDFRLLCIEGNGENQGGFGGRVQ